MCYGAVEQVGEHLRCTDSGCAAAFPIVDGVPVMINESSSLFCVDDFVSRRATTFVGSTGSNSLKNMARRLVPTTSRNVKGASNYERFTEVLLTKSASPCVLVIGGSILGLGMEAIANAPAIELVESDVSFGPRTMLICDAHDLPFTDGVFDGVIVQAVLEHVVDPHRCCDEIHRVLKEDGVVYAETPFMQPVHMGRYDFERFTHLGHRRLFRRFREIDSGAVCGPGMALAWAYENFLLSFTMSRRLRMLLRTFARFTSFYLKYFDSHLVDTPGGLDAAAGCYFLGTRAEEVLCDRDLVTLYRGAMSPSTGDR